MAADADGWLSMIARGLLTVLIVFLASAVCAQTGSMDDLLSRLELQLDARLGVALYFPETGQRIEYHSDERFPLSSTFKMLACAALLHRVDSGQEQLERMVTFTEADLVSYSPVTETRAGTAGMSLAGLCEAALATSDNTAGNLVLQAVGGPDGFTQFMRSIGDDITRLDRWETDLNEARPGDPRDTTTPAAMARATELLVNGHVLTAQSRNQLEQWLTGNTVGDDLLRAGIPRNWTIGDKTGAGGFGSRSIAAIMRPPAGKPVIAAIYITQTAASMAQSNAAIAQIGSAIVNVVISYQKQ